MSFAVRSAVALAPPFVEMCAAVVIATVICVPRVVAVMVIVVGERERRSHREYPFIAVSVGVVVGVGSECGGKSGDKNAGTQYFSASIFHNSLEFIIGTFTLMPNE
jgi:hypothetical protein